MAVMDTLKSAQGGAALAELGKVFGLNAQQATAVVAAIVPELTRKVERNTLSRGGLADIVQALGQGHHREYLRNPALYRHPGAIADGNGILDHLVGGKDGSRGIADRAARATGVDAAVIRKMLPVVAGMTMGGLSQEVQGAFGDILSRMGLPMPSDRDVGGREMGGAGRLGIPDVSQLPGGDAGAGLPMGQDPPPPRQRADGGQTGGFGQGNRTPGYDQGTPGDVWGQRSGGNQRGSTGGYPGGGVRTNPGGGLEMPDLGPQGGDPGYGRGAPTDPGESPFPFPQGGGGNNPYGDLADILRKGLGLPGASDGPVARGPSRRQEGGGQGSGQGSGFPFPMPGGQGSGQGSGQGPGLPFPMPGGAVGGGLLWQIIRSVLGGAAGGFQSKGIVGWIIKAVVMRYGWTILRTILGRGLGR